MSILSRMRSFSLILAALVLAGCTILIPGRTAPRSASAAADAKSEGHRVSIASGDDVRPHRRELLLREGYAILSPEGVGYYMDVQVAKLRQEFAGTDIVIRRGECSVMVVVPGATMFDTNSSRLHPDILVSLDRVADVLTEYRKTLVVVEGHTDNVGPAESNQRLSEQRALSVARYLAQKGIHPARLIVLGRGDTRSVASNESEQGRARNRRVELTLYPLTAAD